MEILSSELSFLNTRGITVSSDTLPAISHRYLPLEEMARRDVFIISYFSNNRQSLVLPGSVLFWLVLLVCPRQPKPNETFYLFYLDSDTSPLLVLVAQSLFKITSFNDYSLGASLSSKIYKRREYYGT